MRFLANFDSGRLFQFDGSPEDEGLTVGEFAAKKLQLACNNGELETYELDGYVLLVDFEKENRHLLDLEAYTQIIVRLNYNVSTMNLVPRWAEKYR